MEERPVVISAQPGDHPLQRRYCFWFMQRATGTVRNSIAAEDYERSIKPIGEFETVEGFWQLYNHLQRPNEIANTAELHLFRAGVKPIWEDKANQHGGKLIIRLVKGLASRYWESLLLAIIGEQFETGDEITGVVVSLRTHEDIIAVWNRNADNQAIIGRIRDNLKQVLDLPAFVRTEYKRHEKRMRPPARGALPQAGIGAPNSMVSGDRELRGASAWRD